MKKHTVKIAVELAINNNGTPVSSDHFDRVLGLKPAEICINEIEAA